MVSKKDGFSFQRKIVDIKTSLGILSFRYISVQDSKWILKEYDEVQDSKLFVKNFIINQMIEPKIQINKLNRLTDSELLSIVKEYLINENLDEFFNIADIDTFSDFKEELYDFLSFYYVPNFKALNIVENHFDNFASTFERINEIVPKLPICNEPFYESSIQISINAVDVLKSLYPIQNDFKAISVLASDFVDAIQPQIDEWSGLIYNNSNFIRMQNRFEEILGGLEEHFKKPMSKALNCLNRYSWFIPLNMDYSVIFDVLSICDGDSNHKQSEINRLFIDYYLDDDCNELFSLINLWNDNPLFKRRSKIFRDCVDVIKNSKSSINFSNLVVPTLISQIDGIQREFMEKNDLKVDYGKVMFLDGSKYDEGNVRWEEYFRDLTNGDEILDAMNDIFLNVLFQKTRPGEDYKTSIHFSRHKILHGENIRYGRKDYTIRCFMILDFLYELSLEN